MTRRSVRAGIAPVSEEQANHWIASPSSSDIVGLKKGRVVASAGMRGAH